jgi:hypothetical protein
MLNLFTHSAKQDSYLLLAPVDSFPNHLRTWFLVREPASRRFIDDREKTKGAAGPPLNIKKLSNVPPSPSSLGLREMIRGHARQSRIWNTSREKFPPSKLYTK